MQQPISFQKEVEKLNTNINPENETVKMIKIILGQYFRLMSDLKIDCSDLKKVVDYVSTPDGNISKPEELIKHLYFDNNFFLSGRHQVLEKVIAKTFHLQDRYASDNKRIFGGYYKKFDSLCKYFSLCNSLIKNDHRYPDSHYEHFLAQDFLRSKFKFPLSNSDLQAINTTIKSNKDIFNRYLRFYASENMKARDLTKALNLYFSIGTESYLRSPERSCKDYLDHETITKFVMENTTMPPYSTELELRNCAEDIDKFATRIEEKYCITAMTSAELQNAVTEQFLDYIKEDLEEKITVLSSLSQSIDEMTQSQTKIINSQKVANENWHAPLQDNEAGRKGVYRDELRYQTSVHEHMQDFSKYFTDFVSVFRSQKNLMYNIISKEKTEEINALLDTYSNLILQEEDLFNSINNRAANAMKARGFSDNLQQIKTIQQDLLTSFSEIPPILKPLVENFKAHMGVLKERLEAIENLQSKIQQNTMKISEQVLETCTPPQKKLLQKHIDDIKQKNKTDAQNDNLPEKPPLDNQSEEMVK